MKLSLMLVVLVGCGGDPFSAAEVFHPDVVDASGDASGDGETADGGQDSAPDSPADTDSSVADAKSDANEHHDSGNCGLDAGHDSSDSGATAEAATDSGTGPEVVVEACAPPSPFQCGDAGTVEPLTVICSGNSVAGTTVSWTPIGTPGACAACGNYNCACVAPYFVPYNSVCGNHPATCSDVDGQVTVICDL